jgi:hypothetical protein
MIINVRFAMFVIRDLVFPLSMMGMVREEFHHWCRVSIVIGQWG